MTETAKCVGLHDEQTATANFGDSMQLAALTDFQDSKTAPPASPQILLILATDETFEVDSPNDIMRLHEIQRRKWNLDGRRPALGRYAGLRRPNAIPARVSVSLVAAAILQPLLICNEAISLGSQRIGLKHVGVAAIARRIDHN